VRKLVGKKPLGRPRPRWADSIKVDIGVIGWSGMNWIDLTQDRDYCRAFMDNGIEPSGSIKCWEVLESLHNSRAFEKGSAPWS
jgi:hypothetical protein